MKIINRVFHHKYIVDHQDQCVRIVGYQLGEHSGEPSMFASRRIHDEQLRKVADSLRQPFRSHNVLEQDSETRGITKKSGTTGRHVPEAR